MSKPNRSADPNHAQLVGEGSPASENAVEDHAAKAAEKLATFVPDCLQGEDRAVIDVVMAKARKYVALAKPGDPDEVRRFMRPMTAYLLHAVKNYESLDPESFLHPDEIDRYIAQVGKGESDSWKINARWVLDRIGQAVVPHLWPKKRTTFGKHNVAVPYSAVLEEAYRIEGFRKCKLGKPEAATVVFGSLALGLNALDIANLSPSSLVPVGEGRLAVHVTGPHARVVPIREAYTDLALAAIEASTGRPFVQTTSTRYQVHKVAERLVVKGHGRLVLARARSTWLQAHLLAGTSLPAIRKLAGPLAMNTLTDLVNYATEELTPEEAVLEGLRA